MKEMKKDLVKEGIDPKGIFKEMGQMCGPSTNCDCKCSDNDSRSKNAVEDVYTK